MHDLNYELKQLCARNRDGSYTTQANRERILMLIANQLWEMGFVNMRAQSLKPKWLVQGADRRRADAMMLATPNSAPAAVHPFCDFSTAADTALPRYDKDELRSRLLDQLESVPIYVGFVLDGRGNPRCAHRRLGTRRQALGRGLAPTDIR